MRSGDLRRHRRPGPQEAASRPSTTWPTGACCRPASWCWASPAATGATATSSRWPSEAARKHARTPWREEVWARLAGNIKFVGGSFDDDAAFDQLAATLDELRDSARHPRQRGVLLLHPAGRLPGRAQAAGPHRHGRQRQVRRLAPGGGGEAVRQRPAARPRQLNDLVDDVFTPQDVFRIDHYLGKETVQNILALRFANNLFEPVWNSKYVDSVQITMAEDVGIGTRAGFYDTVRHRPRRAAEPPAPAARAGRRWRSRPASTPTRSGPRSSRCSRRSRCPSDIATGHGARPVPARLGGRRAGGRLPGGGGRPAGLHHRDVRGGAARHPEPPLGRGAVLHPGRQAAAPPGHRGRRSCSRRRRTCRSTPADVEMLGNNQLVIRVQPDEGVVLKFGSKVPGTTMEVRDIAMDFQYGEAFTESSPEAYERLVLDVLIGDRTLFPDAAEVEQSWRVVDPLEDAWAGTKPEPYRAGEWGPRAADEMLAREGRLAASMTEARRPMIGLWDTTGNEVVKALAAERRSAGGVASGLALTLVAVVDEKQVREAEAAATIAAAGAPVPAAHRGPLRRRAATQPAGRRDRRRRPARPVRGGRDADVRPARAARRVGGDAAAGAGRAGGHLVARRRRRSGSPTTSSAWSPTGGSPTAAQAADPVAALRQRADDYAPGDTDLAWTRITPWRTAGGRRVRHHRGQGHRRRRSSRRDTDPTAALMPAGCRPGSASSRRSGAHRRVPADARCSCAAPTATSWSLTRDDEHRRCSAAPARRTGRCRWPRRPLGDELAEELRRLDADQVVRGGARRDGRADRPGAAPAAAGARLEGPGDRAERRPRPA